MGVFFAGEIGFFGEFFEGIDAFAAIFALGGRAVFSLGEEIALVAVASLSGSFVFDAIVGLPFAFGATLPGMATNVWHPGHLIFLPAKSAFTFKRLPHPHATDRIALAAGGKLVDGMETTFWQAEHLMRLPASSSLACIRLPQVHAKEIAMESLGTEMAES